MKKIGITGGIGSGKSTVCQLFKTLGIPVYNADQRAKWLMENNQSLRSDITALFGKEAYTSQGKLNRQLIAKYVFANQNLLNQLNSLVHPIVAKDGALWHQSQSAPYTIKEAALLFESGSYRALDTTVEVYAPRQVRLRRVMTRDNVSAESVEARMRQQWPEWKKIIQSDYVLLNHNAYAVIPQVWKLHHKLCTTNY